MISFQDNTLNIVESISELPQLVGETLFLDVETTSFDDKKEGFYPYEGNRICGFAVTTNKQRNKAWYIPVRHHSGNNLPVEQVVQWLREQTKDMVRWVNHNVKYDAHFLLQDNYEFPGELVDTVVRAKLVDSDRMEHKLKGLCRDWCRLPMAEARDVDVWVKEARTKDYGRIPIDLLGRYACVDVIGNISLYYETCNRLDDPELREVVDVETKFTSLLFKIEQRGMRVDVTRCKTDLVKSIRTMIASAQTIKDLTDVDFTASNECLHEILVNQLALPVLAYTDKGSPSFDKDAIVLYKNLPEVILDPNKRAVLEMISTYKTEETYKGLFLESFLSHNVNGIIHPVYNQLVRTGRMSCSDPNSQQFNKRAKKLIIPREGYGFGCWDASQIEFRVISHYAQIQEAIKAYNEDPSTDYHSWVAELVGVERSPAKTMNFAMAYGAGRKKMLQQLSHNKSVVDWAVRQAEEAYEAGEITAEAMQAFVSNIIVLKTNEIYQTYHERLPEIRSTANRASDTARTRGYIKTIYGRRRHLPSNMCHKAFNSLSQGCAMDIIKRRMISLDGKLNQDDHMLANVHDELLVEAPIDVVMSNDWREKVTHTLEDVEPIFRVPFKWEGGYSVKNWEEAKG